MSDAAVFDIVALAEREVGCVGQIPVRRVTGRRFVPRRSGVVRPNGPKLEHTGTIARRAATRHWA